jgi:hypothetical protein
LTGRERAKPIALPTLLRLARIAGDTEPPLRAFARAAWRERDKVERLIGRCKQDRVIATRYNKLEVL